MSEANLQLKFDGPELKGHAMDVCLLGPSLLAFGELCTEANNVLNGNRAKVRVLVKADIKANCVTIDLHLVQTIWHQVQGLIANTNVVTAKEILEWIGIFSGGTAAGWKLIQYLRLKKDHKEKTIEIRQEANGNVVIVQIEGNNNSITLPESVYKLSKNVKVVESVKTLVEPVSAETGIDEVTFIHNKKEELKIDKEFAGDLQKAYADDESEPQFFTAHIVTYGPILDPKSKHWKFKLNNKVENLDISETTIAKEALARGGIAVGDTYKVKIEMVEKKTKQGAYKSEFKVKEVIEFTPGVKAEQTWMPFEDK